MYIVGATVEGKHILLLNKDMQSLQGSENLEDAKGCLPDYKSRHGMGRDWSAAVMIHSIEFNPKIFKFENLESINNFIHEDRTIRQYRGTAGSVTGIQLKDGYEPEVVAEAHLV